MTIDLRALDPPSGGARRRSCRVRLDGLTIAGQGYRFDPGEPELDLELSRSLSGRHLRLRGELDLVGPCWRCLGDARVRLALDTREFQAERRAGGDLDTDLDSPYVDGDELDLVAWARDAVAEELPATILCRLDCPGLCASCGARAGSCGCAPVADDPRWSALAGLAERLDPPAGPPTALRQSSSPAPDRSGDRRAIR